MLALNGGGKAGIKLMFDRVVEIERLEQQRLERLQNFVAQGTMREVGQRARHAKGVQANSLR